MNDDQHDAWDKPLLLTRNLFLQPLGVHSYAARASFASPHGVQLDGGTLALLSCFTEPRTPRAARAVLGQTVSCSDDELLATVHVLAGHGLLRDADDSCHSRGAPVVGSGYANPLTQHNMLRDAPRMDAYREAIKELAPGRRVLEIGAGSGVLSIFAARSGATEVIALEESAAIELARAMAAANGVEDRIRFVPVNSLDYRPERRAELIVHELIGHEPFGEHALRYLGDAQHRLLEPGGHMLPSCLEVHCRAVGRAGWVDPFQVQREVGDVAQRHDLALGPLLEALDARVLLPSYSCDYELAERGGRSDDVVLYRVDFTRPIAEQKLGQAAEVELSISRGGHINTLVTHFRARMGEGAWLSNAPEAERTHWDVALHDLPNPCQAQAGQKLSVRARFEPIDGVERTLLELVG